ncbi:hypothetical protein ACFLYA_00445 [Candidatus Dependentiae bacterium]
MISKKHKFLIYFSLQIIFITVIKCANIGSDTSVDRFTTQQILYNGDRVATFAALDAGFKIDNSSATGTFDSVFPVSGDIELNSGTLEITNDILLDSTAEIITFGNITGNNHTFEMSRSTTGLRCTGTNKNITASDITLILNSDIEIKDCQLNFDGNATINGRGNSISFSETGAIKILSNASLLMKDVIIKDLNNTKIENVDSTSTMTVQNVTFVLCDDFSFNNGQLNIKDECKIYGQGYTFSYQSTSSSTICENSKLILQDNTTFCYDPTNESKTLITMDSKSSQIILNGATLHTTKGIELTKGTMVVNNNSSIINDSVTTENAIIFGDGSSSSNNFDIQWKPAACLDIGTGKVINDNV